MATHKAFKRPTSGPVRKRLSRAERFAKGIKRAPRPTGQVAAILKGDAQVYGVTLVEPRACQS